MLGRCWIGVILCILKRYLNFMMPICCLYDHLHSYCDIIAILWLSFHAVADQAVTKLRPSSDLIDCCDHDDYWTTIRRL